MRRIEVSYNLAQIAHISYVRVILHRTPELPPSTPPEDPSAPTVEHPASPSTLNSSPKRLIDLIQTQADLDWPSQITTSQVSAETDEELAKDWRDFMDARVNKRGWVMRAGVEIPRLSGQSSGRGSVCESLPII